MTASGPATAGGLFTGTAAYYERFREPYPAAFVELLAQSCRLRRNGRLLDLGCGPGLLAVAFARRASEVVGLDPEPEMLAAAAERARQADAFNIRWIRGGSKDLGPHLGQFRMVTIGRAFHWMDRVSTLASLHELVIPGGVVAIIGEERERDPGSWRAVMRRLSDARGDERAPHEDNPSHDQIMAASPFRGPEYLRWPVVRTWGVEEILGHLRSTSMGANRTKVGTTEAFETEARRALLDLEPSGRFIETFRFRAMIGWRD
jgi:SAM-dependent methyltransferase